MTAAIVTDQPPTPTVGVGHLLGPVGPGEVLAGAAVLLGRVCGGAGPVLYADLHEVMLAALRELGVGRDRHHRLALADTARDQLAVFLVATGAAADGGRTSRTLRGWVVGQRFAGVRAALWDAAAWWRHQQPASGWMHDRARRREQAGGGR